MASVLYHALWRLAFLLAFFVLPGLVDQSQVDLRDTLPPLRRAAALPFTIFLLLYSYHLGGELFKAEKRKLRWALLACLLFPALLLALCLLVVLGTHGEVWMLRAIALFALGSALRHALSFLSNPQGAEPLLALGDLAYLGSVFFAALHRHYQQWTELAVFTLGELKGARFWAPSAAGLLFLATVSLYLHAARLSSLDARHTAASA